MPNFKLVFQKHFEDQDDDLLTGRYERVISVEDIKLANKIAKAMLGEEIYANEWLSGPVSVNETTDSPHIGAWNADKTWRRVLERLELTESQIEFIYYTGPSIIASFFDGETRKYRDVIGEVTERVGFKLK